MKGFKMGTIKGIAIEIHPSWLIIFALLSFMLATGYFPENYPEWSQAVVWILSILMAGLLFASVLLHELSHSLVSKKLGIEVSRITLFIFGGLAQMEKEPDEPSKELKIAIAGPFMSIFLGAFFFLVSRIAGVLGAGEEVMVPILYAMGANFILAIFNLVPAFPLDGGRVFRALLWGWKG
ncbi:MAG TPA: hypothetical protein DHN33_07105, partial [Eubacteriaceae bacterium]|nr:hypothetical protein [Eubacteriaceae bacterium]